MASPLKTFACLAEHDSHSMVVRRAKVAGKSAPQPPAAAGAMVKKEPRGAGCVARGCGRGGGGKGKSKDGKAKSEISVVSQLKRASSCSAGSVASSSSLMSASLAEAGAQLEEKVAWGANYTFIFSLGSIRSPAVAYVPT